jgi:hypothetical protein
MIKTTRLALPSIVRTVAALSCLMCVCVFPLAAQKSTSRQRTRTPQAVARQQAITIRLKAGGSVNGDLIRADAGGVQIKTGGARRVIRLDEVESIVFPTEPAGDARSRALAPQAATAARTAIKELRKLAGATEIGVSFREYGTRLIDVKNAVDDALASIQEGELKKEISLALEAYVDAGHAWNTIIKDGNAQYDYTLSFDAEWMRIVEKYSLSPESSLVYGNDKALSAIWREARSHLERASTLLGQ